MKEENRILIVDDEPNIVMTLDFALQKKGYETFIARDGDEAIDILNKENIDLILLDVMMSRVDGYQVVKHIKSIPAMVDVKIILLTAKNKSNDIDYGYNLGIDEYVTKPFSMKNLTEIIQELLKTKV